MAIRALPEMPCGPILELHGQRKRFHIPYGLKSLIEDMTREVLRFQPDNIYDFLANFMEARLQKRLEEEAKKNRRKSWQSYRWSWEGTSILKPEELTEFLEEIHIPNEEATHHAIVIQSAFRGYQARKKVKTLRKSIELEREEKRASLVAEEEKRRASLEPGVDAPVLSVEKPGGDGNEKEAGHAEPNLNRRNTLDITPQNATDVEQHSAVVIQSAFRGMQSRKKVKELRKSLEGIHTGTGVEGEGEGKAEPKEKVVNQKERADSIKIDDSESKPVPRESQPPPLEMGDAGKEDAELEAAPVEAAPPAPTETKQPNDSETDNQEEPAAAAEEKGEGD